MLELIAEAGLFVGLVAVLGVSCEMLAEKWGQK